jgi:hypothetical protein
MNHLYKFENFKQQEEDQYFLNNIKDILLEYLDKYYLVEFNSDDLDSEEKIKNSNGIVNYFLVKPLHVKGKSIGNEDYIEVIFKIKGEKLANQFLSDDSSKLISRLKKFGYRVELLNTGSMSNYSLYYRLFIYKNSKI